MVGYHTYFSEIGKFWFSRNEQLMICFIKERSTMRYLSILTILLLFTSCQKREETHSSETYSPAVAGAPALPPANIGPVAPSSSSTKPQTPPPNHSATPKASDTYRFNIIRDEWPVLSTARGSVDGIAPGFPQAVLKGHQLFIPLTFLTKSGFDVDYKRSTGRIIITNTKLDTWHIDKLYQLPVVITHDYPPPTTIERKILFPYLKWSEVRHLINRKIGYASPSGISIKHPVVKGSIVLSSKRRKIKRKLHWQTIINQKLKSAKTQWDGRVKVTCHFTIDASRKNEFMTHGDYIVSYSMTVTNVSRVPILTGNFALFLRTNKGYTAGEESMAQSARSTDFLLLPGQSNEKMIVGRALIMVSADELINKVIYNDGISVLEWAVNH